jgi:hypothetical protein
LAMKRLACLAITMAAACGSVQATDFDAAGGSPDAAQAAIDATPGTIDADPDDQPDAMGVPDARPQPDANPADAGPPDFQTERINVSASGVEANAGASEVAISRDGRYVTFNGGTSSNLVPEDTLSNYDVYRFDRLTDELRVVAVTSAGVHGTGTNYADPDNISGDGMHIIFDCSSVELGCTGGNYQVVRHSFSGGQRNSLIVSRDASHNIVGGSYGYPDDDGDVIAWNLNNVATIRTLNGVATTQRVDLTDADGIPNADGYAVAISADGNVVLVSSSATNIVANDTNAKADLFARDISAGRTFIMSLADNEAPANDATNRGTLSSNGNFAAFASAATNLVTGDDNFVVDVFVRDRSAGTTQRVSVSSAGAQANGASKDFPVPEISGDGRYVAFASDATNLVPDDTNGVTDVFVHDRMTGRTIRVSVAADGTQGNAAVSYGLDISADGKWVTFSSGASNLVPNDTNGQADAFVVRNVLAP